MPRKHSRKNFLKGGYYHIFNRGVDKRKIFMNDKDYVVFLRYLKEYLLPKDDEKRKDLLSNTPRRKPINCHDEVALLSYCLMPNHFHLFIKQKTKYGMSKFMKVLTTNYVMYFNHKHKRQGALFQGVYKAVRIKNDAQYLHISRYIHRNPLEILKPDQELSDYPYSSYKYYLSGSSPKWLDINSVSKMFGEIKDPEFANRTSYQYFVEKYKPTRDKIRNLKLE